MDHDDANGTPKGIRKEKTIGPYLRSQVVLFEFMLILFSQILNPLTVSAKTAKKVDDFLVESGEHLFQEECIYPFRHWNATYANRSSYQTFQRYQTRCC